MAHIFISYSRRDSLLVHPIADGLRAVGYPVWIDVSGIQGGATWLYEIQKAIVESFAVVVMWSQAAHQSEWVQREIIFALDQRKPIIPLLLDSTRLNLALINIQPISGQLAISEVVERLQGVLPPLSDNGTLPEPPAPITAPVRGQSLVSFRQQLLAENKNTYD